MKVLAIVKYAFTVIGFSMLIGAFIAYKSSSSFVAEAIKVEATVVDLVAYRSSGSTTYKPLVKFVDQNGRQIELLSSAGSNPPSYSQGQTVEVFYRPAEPQNAKINSFFDLWGAAFVLGALGGTFFLIGSGMMIAGTLKGRKDEFLKSNGTPIETEFQGVEQNTSVSVNGRYPFRVLTHWLNPSTSELHIFKSNNLWFDPSSYIKSKKITVFIDPSNPKKYLMDLAFLPKIAE
jgi:hypothetical protein